MPRLNVVKPENSSGEAKKIYDDLIQQKGKVFNIFQGMANSPAALKAYLSMSSALAEGELSPEEREIVYLAVSEHNDCHYCASAHSLVAKKAGLSDEAILAARRFAAPDEKHQSLLHFVKRVIQTKGFVDDKDLASVREAGYTDGQIAEAVGYIALATFSNLFNHVHDTPLDFPAAPSLK